MIRCKASLLFIFLFFTFISYSQQKPIIYFLPGQGSDYRIFDSLFIDTSYSKKYIEYPMPEKGMNMKQFAKVIVNNIDTTKPIILVGVSLGGMLSVEIAELIPVSKVIIISSAKNKNELPLRYRTQNIFPLYKIIPPKMLHISAKALQPIVEPDRNKNKATFKKMLYAKNPLYIKRTIHMIVTWDRIENSSNIIQIHGTKDHTIPIRNVQAQYIVARGSHMMCLTKGRKIGELINQILK